MPTAFPTAEGFGKDSVGGRGGTVIHVTNLNNTGVGSFREAVTASGPRIVVFDVSGTIQLATQITITTPYLTIAGQTSPGGVQIRGTPGTPTGITFAAGCHDVIVRHLRVRIGGNEANDDGESLLVYSTSAAPNHCYNMIFDHCSVEWGHDGQMMVYGNWDLITWQWCLDAKPIYDVSLNGGREGIHVGGSTLDMTNHGRITLTKNAFIHCAYRIPNMSRARIFDVTSNYMFNWSGNNGSIIGQNSTGSAAQGNFRSNRYKKGPNSGAVQRNNYVSNAVELGGTKMFTDNGNWGYNVLAGGPDDWVMFRDQQVAGDNQASAATYRVSVAFSTPAVTVIPPATMETDLLPFVGAYKPSRDSVDQGYIDEAIAGTGALATSSDSGGPWPTLTGGSPPVDTNNDGVPDYYALQRGFTVNDSIANLTAPSGWTYIEDYLNYALAGDPVPEVPAVPPHVVQVGTPFELASGTTLSPTLSGVIAGNHLFYVATAHNTGATPTLSTPTQNGGWTELVESDTGNNMRIAIGLLHATGGGSYAPTITLPASTRGSAVLLEVAGLAVGGASDISSTAFASITTPATGLVTPPNSNSFVLAAVTFPGTTTTITPAAGWTQQLEDEGTTPGPAWNIVAQIAPAGDVQGQWTLASARQGVCAAVALAGELGQSLLPTPVSLSVSVPAPVIGVGDIAVGPAVVSGVTSVPAPFVGVDLAVVQPATVPLTLSCPAPTLAFTLSVAPAPVPCVCALPPPLLLGGFAPGMDFPFRQNISIRHLRDLLQIRR